MTGEASGSVGRRRRRDGHPLSLRSRILAGMAIVTIVLAVVAVVIAATTRSQLIDQIDDRLADGAANDRSGVFVRGDSSDSRDRDGDRSRPVVPERQSDFYEGYVSGDGTLTTFFVPNIGGEDYAPPALEGETIRISRNRPTLLTVDATEGSVNYRVLAVASPDGAGVSLIALPLNDVESTISRLVLIEVVGIGAILAVLGLVTWWMLRLGVRPIKQMTSTASAIAAGDLSARIDETSPAAESRELATALNTMLATIEDAIDERARSEERLRRFVADASHELRTPVTTIRGYAELYRVGGLRAPGALDDAMRRTEQEAQRMSRLVEDMLLLAKLDEHRPVEYRSVDLAQLAADAGADARVVAAGRTIEVDAPEPVVVAGDSDRLRQVFANLVANALTHTDDHAVVTIRVHGDDGRAVVEVVDTGHGMPQEVAARVTERFFRADPSRARSRGGSGLGLSIVESAVSAHEGDLTVTSEIGVGTTVSISLPLES